MARPLTATLAALILLAGTSAVAEQRTLTLDPARSTVRFTLGATLHTVHGSAPVAYGEVAFDSDGGPASGEIAVDASRTDTGSAKRDRKMHENVLVSAQYPSVILRPTRLVGRLPEAGIATLTVHGTLELLGRRHDIALPVEVDVAGNQVTIAARFEVPYVEWGLHDPSAFLLKVDKFVTVEVAGAGRLSSASGQAGVPPRSAQDQPQP